MERRGSRRPSYKRLEEVLEAVKKVNPASDEAGEALEM